MLRPIDLPQAKDLYLVEYGKHHFEQSFLITSMCVTGAADSRCRGLYHLFRRSGQRPRFLAGLALRMQRELLRCLRNSAAPGRFFHGSDEHGPDSAPYIVLSYAYWRNHYQGDPAVVGRTVQLNKYPYTVLGVAPPKFRGTALFFAADLWVPLVNQTQIEGENKLNARGRRALWIVGRQETHGDPGAAHRRSRFYRRMVGEDLSQRRRRRELLCVASRADGYFVGKAARAFVTGLMVLAGLILLAACANLGSLFAAQAADRAKEVALRLALGSSRRRVLRQLLTEATMISLAGGVVGLAGSVALLPWLSAWHPLPEFPINVPVNPDANVYVVALLLALVSGILFGMVPLRQVLGAIHIR